MTDDVNRQILLASRPDGAPTPANFRLAETAIPEPGEGEVLYRAIYLSLDPYHRGRMNAGASYAEPVPIDGVMGGGSVGRVVSSNAPGLSEGDYVLGYGGWQEYAVMNARHLRKLDPEVVPISTALGVLGMPGMTAYSGLMRIGEPKDGETVVVAAASGPVGGTVGQIAKLKGCRAIGIAGGDEKCAFVRDELGFDDCINHRRDDLGDALAAACPDGIDVYFENVGGKVFDAVYPLLNFFARIPVCGVISRYNIAEAPPGPDRLPGYFTDTLVKRIRTQGFIVTDFEDMRPDFVRDMSQWVRDGQVRYREDIAQGIENVPETMIGLLQGKNFGKQLVRVAEDPTR